MGDADLPRRPVRRPARRGGAGSGSSTPARPAHRGATPTRPDLPVDEAPQLPRSVEREIRSTAPRGQADDVALALSRGAAAIDEGLLETALEHLRWAKDMAPRSGAVREALGVALYLDEQWGPALSELRAYRRLTGRNDQNHLIADAQRALGRTVDEIERDVSPLVADRNAPTDRRIEALIVWMAALAEVTGPAAARSLGAEWSDRLLAVADGDDEAVSRLHYLLGDLAERDGDPDGALERFSAVADGYLDVDDRRRALRARP